MPCKAMALKPSPLSGVHHVVPSSSAVLTMVVNLMEALYKCANDGKCLKMFVFRGFALETGFG